MASELLFTPAVSHKGLFLGAAPTELGCWSLLGDALKEKQPPPAGWLLGSSAEMHRHLKL